MDSGTVMLWSFFGTWLVWSVMGFHKKQSSTVAVGGGFLAACVMLVAVSSFIRFWESRLPDAKEIGSAEEAQKFVVGTWVYAQPITNTSLLEWMRWEIKSDGTLIEQTASPRDNQWGTPRAMKYTVFTDKYSDTGDRFYGIRITNTAMSGAIQGDGRLFVRIAASPYSGAFVRGDKDLNN